MVYSERKTILVDLDDTLTDLCLAWCDWLNKKYNTSVSPEDIADWDIAKFFSPLTKDEIFSPLLLEEFWETVKPKVEASKYLERLCEEGYDIYICTATDYRTIRVKYESIIQKYFPYISWEKIIVCNRKQMINADCLVDDGFHNLIGGTYKKILFSAPHNRIIDEHKFGMVRVDSWQSVYKTIHCIV